MSMISSKNNKTQTLIIGSSPRKCEALTVSGLFGWPPGSSAPLQACGAPVPGVPSALRVLLRSASALSAGFSPQIYVCVIFLFDYCFDAVHLDLFFRFSCNCGFFLFESGDDQFVFTFVLAVYEVGVFTIVYLDL